MDCAKCSAMEAYVLRLNVLQYHDTEKVTLVPESNLRQVDI